MPGRSRAPRVIWSLAGLFALCVVGVGLLVVRQAERAAETAAARQAESLARGAETALNRSFLAVDLMLAGLPRMSGLDGIEQGRVDRAAADAVLASRVAQSLSVHDIMLIDAQGRVLATADHAKARLGAQLPAGFLALVRSQPAPRLLISAPASHDSTGEKALYMARAVGAGGVVAVAEVPVASLTTMMAPTVELGGVSITLEDDQGTLLASAPFNDSLLGRRHTSPLMRLAADGKAQRSAGRLDGAPALVSVRPSLYPSVRVSAAISLDAVSAATQGVRTATLAIGGAFIALGAVAAWLAQTYLARIRAATDETVRARRVLEQALASMDEGFLLWDEHDRVVSWNERYLALFPHMRSVIGVGVSLHRMTEAGVAAVLPGADAARREAWIADRQAHHRSDGQLFEQRLPDGTVVSAVERRTATGGIVSIYRDVTRERAAAAELERARRVAESANEAKTRFLATMSHEIRTPLNGILGMNELLLHSPLDERQRRFAETIRSSGDALLTILNDILDMSRLEAGGMALELIPFDPRALVAEVVTLLQARAAGKGITLEIDGPAGAAPRLVGDAGRLRQVLFNLVGNAIKFTDRGGVTLRSSFDDLRAGAVCWTVVVQDTGIGIPPQALPTLFERFTQADTSTSRRYGGSGLGLAICRQLVGLMNGSIDVRSEPGQGSEFRVRVELAVAPPPAAGDAVASARPATAGGRRLHVLVAEDNAVNQLLLQELLEQLGHGCELVANGREAVQRLREARFDAVLMDIQMPEMDGVEATLAIRALAGASAQVPIIAVTANVLPDQRRAYLDAGMDDYVAKPLDLSRLQEVLGRLGATA
jgi:signal transduction histidine kinase